MTSSLSQLSRTWIWDTAINLKQKFKKHGRCGSRSSDNVELSYFTCCLQSTAMKCTKSYNVRAQPLLRGKLSRCCMFLMVVQKLAFCRNKNSLKVVIARHVTRDNFPRNKRCAESCCCELSHVTLPLSSWISNLHRRRRGRSRFKITS